jgi:hypothetical protein
MKILGIFSQKKSDPTPPPPPVFTPPPPVFTPPPPVFTPPPPVFTPPPPPTQQLPTPTINASSVVTTSETIVFTVNNQNSSNIANVTTQVRIGTSGDFTDVATFSNQQTNITVTLSNLEFDKVYSFQVKNTTETTGFTDSNTSTGGGTTKKGILRVRVSTDDDTFFSNTVPLQWFVTGGTTTIVDLGTSYTTLTEEIDTGSNVDLLISETFTRNDITYTLDSLTVNKGEIPVEVGVGDYSISDMKLSTDLTFDYKSPPAPPPPPVFTPPPPVFTPPPPVFTPPPPVFTPPPAPPGGACLAIDTIIQMADGTSKRIDELKPGDWLKG